MVKPAKLYRKAVKVIGPVAEHDWLYAFTFPWSNNHGENIFKIAPGEFKRFPGCHYAPEYGKGTWVIPVEGLGWLRDTAAKLALGFDAKTDKPLTNKLLESWIVDLHPYQIDGANKALQQNALLIAYEMGLGKTATAVTAISQIDATRTLVVCPAIVRQGWEREINQWWTGEDKPPVRIVTSKDDAPKRFPKGVVVTSYELLKEIPSTNKLDALVIDESHYIKNSDTKRSQRVKSWRRKNPNALTLLLTGTPIADSPTDLWNQLDTLYSDRYGGFWKFAMRYAGKDPNEFADSGFDFKGLDPDFAQELADRLQYVTHRITKAEVAHLLPPITLSGVQLEGDRIDESVKWCRNAVESGAPRIVVFTHLRATAHEISDLLDKHDIASTVITGETPPAKRLAAIKVMQKYSPHVIVCTMASVGIGIDDLAGYDQVLFAELDPYPVIVLQALARVHRLSSTKAVNGNVLIGSGYDQATVIALKRKIRDMAKLLEKGTGEKAIAESLEGESQEAWQKRIQRIVREMGRDEYNE